MIRAAVLRWAWRRMQRRKPNLVIGDERCPYLRRWHVIPFNRFCGIYLHEILRSDDDRALHDHPYGNVSWILLGEYLEQTPTGRHWRRVGSLTFRWPTQLHRLIVPWELDGNSRMRGRKVITLFFTGPRVREWGFQTERGWVPWQEFLGGDVRAARAKGGA